MRGGTQTVHICCLGTTCFQKYKNKRKYETLLKICALLYVLLVSGCPLFVSCMYSKRSPAACVLTSIYTILYSIIMCIFFISNLKHPLARKKKSSFYFMKFHRRIRWSKLWELPKWLKFTWLIYFGTDLSILQVTRLQHMC